MDDLTDRLREPWDKWPDSPPPLICREAADEIDRLRAQIAALQAEVERLRELESGACAMLEAALSQVQRVTAERDALRADAERYRFVRDAERSDGIADELLLYTMDSLDRCVDEAMQREAKNAAIDAARGAEGGSDA